MLGWRDQNMQKTQKTTRILNLQSVLQIVAARKSSSLKCSYRGEFVGVHYCKPGAEVPVPERMTTSRGKYDTVRSLHFLILHLRRDVTHNKILSPIAWTWSQKSMASFWCLLRERFTLISEPKKFSWSAAPLQSYAQKCVPVEIHVKHRENAHFRVPCVQFSDIPKFFSLFRENSRSSIRWTQNFKKIRAHRGSFLALNAILRPNLHIGRVIKGPKSHTRLQIAQNTCPIVNRWRWSRICHRGVDSWSRDRDKPG